MSIPLAFSVGLVISTPKLLVVSIEICMILDILGETLWIGDSLILSAGYIKLIVIQLLSFFLLNCKKVCIVSFECILLKFWNLLKAIASSFSKSLLSSHLLNRFLKCTILLILLMLFFSFTIDIIFVNQFCVARHLIVRI